MPQRSPRSKPRGRQAREVAPEKQSAGLMMYRHEEGALRVLVAHPGGPFFRNRDDGMWTIPKGELGPGEAPLEAAVREFREETGIEPSGHYLPLGSVHQRGGKTVHAWAFESQAPVPPSPPSNTFTIEWPRGSGRTREYPEIDRLELVDPETARRRLNPAQAPFVDVLIEYLRESG